MSLPVSLLNRLLRFALVGGGVMIFFMSLNALFGRWWGATGAFVAAYPPAVLLHFVLNKGWTFGCTRPDTRRQIVEYLVMVVITFGVQYVFFWIARERFGLAGWLSAGLANIAQMGFSFVVMQARIFAPARS